MKLAEIVRADGAQLVKLPEGFQLARVSYLSSGRFSTHLV